MSDGSSARRGDVLLLVGTRKGSFIFSSDPSRRKWEMSGPYHPGADVFHLTYDHRSGGRNWNTATTWERPGRPPRSSPDFPVMPSQP